MVAKTGDPILQAKILHTPYLLFISCAVDFVEEHIEARFPWLMDERSFSSWAPHFAEFAAAFVRKGLPIDNLVAFIDGKLCTARIYTVLYTCIIHVHLYNRLYTCIIHLPACIASIHAGIIHV